MHGTAEDWLEHVDSTLNATRFITMKPAVDGVKAALHFHDTCNDHLEAVVKTATNGDLYKHTF